MTSQTRPSALPARTFGGMPPTVPEALVRLRADAEFSDKELARALAVTVRSIKRWRGGGAISSESEEAVYDFARLIMVLSQLVPPANTHAWFLHRNSFLEEARPIDVFAASGYEAVIPAVDALTAGAY